jgi:hypothetical protein
LKSVDSILSVTGCKLSLFERGVDDYDYGEIMEVEEELRFLENYIVAIEIVDFKPKN